MNQENASKVQKDSHCEQEDSNKIYVNIIFGTVYHFHDCPFSNSVQPLFQSKSERDVAINREITTSHRLKPDCSHQLFQ